MDTQVIRNRDDLVEVLRARKAQLGLSNAFIDNALLMADGGADKVLGPTQAKGLTLLVAFDLIELLGGQLVFQVNPELEAKMQERWERREEKKVHPSRRVSRSILERAKPLLFAELGRAGGRRRVECQTASQRSESARMAAHSRWRIHRAAVKARAVAEAAGASGIPA